MPWQKIQRKRIWTGDKVRVIGGKYDGMVGVVSKREPATGAPARYVWIRTKDDRPNAVGKKVSVTFVFILEKTKLVRNKRYRDR